MIKSKFKDDISAIECTADECEITIKSTENDYIQIEYPRSVKAYAEKGGMKLTITQKSGLISRLLGNKSLVTIFVPEHIVPALSFGGGEIDVEINGGIYGDINFSAEQGSIIVEEAAAESLTANSSICHITLANCTIRGNIVTTVEKSGDVSLEHTFATHIASRTKSGNIGAVELNCKDTIFEVGEGNVTATVLGDESTFDVIVNAKEGTCNKESLNIENNECSFKAYVQKGNIFVDFVDDKEN